MTEPALERPAAATGGRRGQGFLAGVLAVLGCQLAGETVVRALGVSFPGPVVGMVLFVIVLAVVRPAPEAAITRAPSALLRHLQLLFVPAGVGIITSLDELDRMLLPIASGLWLSWLVGIVVVGWLVQLLIRRRAGAGDE